MKKETIYRIPTRKNETLKNMIPRKLFHKPKCGCECIYIQLNTFKGIKIFSRKWDAVFARNRQLKACDAGIAPKVLTNIYKCSTKNIGKYDRYCEGVLSRDTPYAYFFGTQVAKTPAGYRTPKEMNRVHLIFNTLGYGTDQLFLCHCCQA